MMKPPFKTFADQLIGQGVKFSPETVIVDVSDLPPNMQAMGGYNKALFGVCVPPFDSCFLEDRGHTASRGIYSVWDSATRTINAMTFVWVSADQLIGETYF